MLSQVADVVTIVVLGSSVLYTLWRVLSFVWERVVAAGPTRALVPTALFILAMLASSAVLIWQVSSIVNETGELAAGLTDAQNRIEVLESKASALGQHAHSADYDSDWISLSRNCRVYSREIGFPGLPEHVTAYYRVNGEVMAPWGMNQATHSNGALLDFDGQGTLYIRLPCGNNRARQLDFGSYRSRDDRRNDAYNDEEVDIRVLLWQTRVAE